VRASKLAVPHHEAAGRRRHPALIASIFGRETGGRMTYNAVKAAEISLAKSLAQQLARETSASTASRRARSSFPAGRWWKRQQADPEGIAEFVRRELPFGRFGTSEEVCPGRRVPGLRQSQLGPAAPASSSTAASRGRSSD